MTIIAENIRTEIKKAFQDLNVNATLCMSPGEATDIMMEPLEKEIAFVSANQFLRHQLTILDAFAQERSGYDPIDLDVMLERLLPIMLKSGMFG